MKLTADNVTLCSDHALTDRYVPYPGDLGSTVTNINYDVIGALRHELGEGYEYEFVEATIRAPMAKGVLFPIQPCSVTVTYIGRYSRCDMLTHLLCHPGVEALSSSGHEAYAFFDPQDLSNTLQHAIDQLDKYISMEGPFDGIMGFSAGAVLAATYMLQKVQKSGADHRPFKCAVLLSSAESTAELNYLGLGNSECNGLIPVPTAHIWGLHDDTAPTGGEDLSRICNPTNRLVFVHDGGHEPPRSSHLTEAAHIIRRITRLGRSYRY